MSKRVTFFEPQGGLTPKIVSDVLGLVEVEVTPQAIALWTDMERLLAYDYAIRGHLRASDNLVRLRPMPHFVRVHRRLGITPSTTGGAGRP